MSPKFCLKGCLMKLYYTWNLFWDLFWVLLLQTWLLKQWGPHLRSLPSTPQVQPAFGPTKIMSSQQFDGRTTFLQPAWNILRYFEIFWTILRYFEIFWDILNYFELFWTILNYFELFWGILNYFAVFWTILRYFELFWTILNYFEIFWTILNYFELFWGILRYFELFWGILNYFEVLELVGYSGQTYETQPKLPGSKPHLFVRFAPEVLQWSIAGLPFPNVLIIMWITVDGFAMMCLLKLKSSKTSCPLKSSAQLKAWTRRSRFTRHTSVLVQLLPRRSTGEVSKSNFPVGLIRDVIVLWYDELNASDYRCIDLALFPQSFILLVFSMQLVRHL